MSINTGAHTGINVDSIIRSDIERFPAGEMYIYTPSFLFISSYRSYHVSWRMYLVSSVHELDQEGIFERLCETM